ncbi:hypothetical protein ACHAW6_004370 [Cyclotella cf. meneghiniana]
MADTDVDREPVAGLSAASSCIRISICLPATASSTATSLASNPASSSQELLTFRPVFTHQCFPDEFLKGWRPIVDAECEAGIVYRSWKRSADTSNNICNADGELHPSFTIQQRRDNNNDNRIDVHVKLAPSCSTCKIEIKTSNSEDISVDEIDVPAWKKMKANPLEQLPIRGSQMNERMDINDILQRLSVAVPPILSVHVNGGRFGGWNSSMKTEKKTMHFQYLDQPIGRIVKSYLRKINKSKAEAKFVITMAEGTEKEASDYQESIQKLARWFIESADDIDLSGNSDNREDGGGYWSVLYLFREHSVCHGEDNDTVEHIVRYSLAGYLTLFHFHAPFKKPEPGIVLRVCQALIFPPYQRAGHGSEMLHSVYEYAEKYAPEGSKIVEVNVEDPAPGFIALRNCVDYSRFSKLVAATPGITDSRPGVTEKDFFSSLSEETFVKITILLKITKRQAQIVHEMYTLEQLMKWRQQTLDASNENCRESIRDMETQYRLMIKKSLRALRKEELGACSGGKEEQKALLEQWFQETLAYYCRLLRIR